MLYIQKKEIYKIRGITMVEVLMSIAILAILTAVTVPLISQAWHTETNVEYSFNALASSLREARLKSFYYQNNSEYGVYLSKASGVLDQAFVYKGENYISGEAISDISLSQGIQAELLNGAWPLDLHFTKYSGASQEEIIMMTSADSGKNYSILINQDGNISKLVNAK
jgi:type II secretory pathway pseudopilin PulG